MFGGPKKPNAFVLAAQEQARREALPPVEDIGRIQKAKRRSLAKFGKRSGRRSTLLAAADEESTLGAG